MISLLRQNLDMYPLDADALEGLGRAAEQLLRGRQEWVIRRKESIRFADDRVVRRTMSIDYELPSWLAASEESAASEPIYYAPLFFLQKGSDDLPPPGPTMVEPEPLFATFDLRDGDGHAMSLPPRSWNASVSVEAMRWAMKNAADKVELEIKPMEDNSIRSVLRKIASSERNESVNLLEDLLGDEQIPLKLDKLRTLLKGDATFRWLAAACAESSVAMVPLVGEQALQGIVKLAFDQEVITPPLRRRLGAAAGLGGHRVWLDMPYIGARTYHVEISAPDGLEIYEAGVIGVAETGGDETVPLELQRRSGFASQIHLYVDDASEQHGALTWIALRAERHGFVGVAAPVAVLVTSVLWLAYALASKVRTSPSGIPELLLLFPGLIAAYAARPGIHRLTTRLLFLTRSALLALSATPYVAAAALALVPRESDVLVDERFKPVWLYTAIFASICTVLLALAWMLPQPLLLRQHLRATPRRWCDAVWQGARQAVQTAGRRIRFR
jgi:hypothetical protein